MVETLLARCEDGYNRRSSTVQNAGAANLRKKARALVVAEGGRRAAPDASALGPRRVELRRIVKLERHNSIAEENVDEARERGGGEKKRPRRLLADVSLQRRLQSVLFTLALGCKARDRRAPSSGVVTNLAPESWPDCRADRPAGATCRSTSGQQPSFGCAARFLPRARDARRLQALASKPSVGLAMGKKKTHESAPCNNQRRKLFV